MIQQMLNFVWAICVGKLMLNDIPHLLDNPGPRPGSMTARAIELWKGGYTYDQIARALGTSIGVVSVLLTRARKTYGEEIASKLQVGTSRALSLVGELLSWEEYRNDAEMGQVVT